jgi:hypothetical protein
MRRTDPRRPRRPAPLRPASGTDDTLLLTLSLRLEFAANRASAVFLREAGGRVERALPHALDADVTAEPVGRALLDAIADYLVATGRLPRPNDPTEPPDAAEPPGPGKPADG